MKLEEALKDIQLLYIETAPLIYYVEENPVYIDQMSFIVDYLEQSQNLRAVSSVITLTEVLTQPLKLKNSVLTERYQDILLNNAEFDLLPVIVPIAESAAELRARYNLRTPDALHLATAIDAGADAFLTNDLGLKRVTELKILILDELELSSDKEDEET